MARTLRMRVHLDLYGSLDISYEARRDVLVWILGVPRSWMLGWWFQHTNSWTGIFVVLNECKYFSADYCKCCIPLGVPEISDPGEYHEIDEETWGNKWCLPYANHLAVGEYGSQENMLELKKAKEVLGSSKNSKPSYEYSNVQEGVLRSIVQDGKCQQEVFFLKFGKWQKFSSHIYFRSTSPCRFQPPENISRPPAYSLTSDYYHQYSPNPSSSKHSVICVLLRQGFP